MSDQIEQTDVRSRIARWATSVHQSEPDNSGPDAPGHGREHDVSGKPHDRLLRVHRQPTGARADETIGWQTAPLRVHAEQQGLEVAPEWVFEDESHSGATLIRPAPGAPA